MSFDLAAVIAQKKADGLYRHRRTLASGQGATVRVDGRDLLNFCSNDYLGLASHPEVVAAFQQAAANYAEHEGKPFYEPLLEFMSSGPVTAAEVVGGVGTAVRARV